MALPMFMLYSYLYTNNVAHNFYLTCTLNLTAVYGTLHQQSKFKLEIN